MYCDQMLQSCLVFRKFLLPDHISHLSMGTSDFKQNEALENKLFLDEVFSALARGVFFVPATDTTEWSKYFKQIEATIVVHLENRLKFMCINYLLQ